MGGVRSVESRICAGCNHSFIPKPGGYTAMYCADKCKTKVQRARNKTRPDYKGVTYDSANYLRAKADPRRYAMRLAHGRRQREVVRGWLSDYKLEHGCVDCGYKVHPAALQLDHEGTKSVEISEARSSISRLQREITEGECVVRCANCHSIKTWAERNGIENPDGKAVWVSLSDRRKSL